MNCSQARKILYPEPAKCEVTTEHAAAMQHARECAECDRYFQEQRQWSQLLKEKAGTEKAPESLRTEVEAAVAHDHGAAPRIWFRTRRLALFAALVITVVIPAVWLTWDEPSVSFFSNMCQDHARYLNGQADVQSAEPEVVEIWLRQQTEYAIQVPSLEDTTLLGGRLCHLREKPAALVFYRKRERPVSLFQFSENGVNLGALNRSVIEGAPIWRGSFHGYNLAAFPQRGLIFVLVSDLRESELLELASEARAQSRGF